MRSRRRDLFAQYVLPFILAALLMMGLIGWLGFRLFVTLTAFVSAIGVYVFFVRNHTRLKQSTELVLHGDFPELQFDEQALMNVVIFMWNEKDHMLTTDNVKDIVCTAQCTSNLGKMTSDQKMVYRKYKELEQAQVT